MLPRDGDRQACRESRDFSASAALANEPPGLAHQNGGFFTLGVRQFQWFNGKSYLNG